MKESEKNIEANDTYVQWILEAIRKIKQQKQRPGRERISNAVRMKHPNVSREYIFEQLELAVKCDKITKVFSCNDYTYKDPAVEAATPHKPLGRKPLGQKPVGRKLGVRRIDYLDTVIKCLKETKEPKGVPMKTIDKYVRSKHGGRGGVSASELARTLCISVRNAVKKGQLIQDGKLIKLPNSKSANELQDLQDFEVVLPFERNKVIIYIT